MCQQAFCTELKKWHNKNKGICPGFDCSFQWESCMQSSFHTPYNQPYKTVPLAGGNFLTLLTYEVTVFCDADGSSLRIAPEFLPQDPITECVDEALVTAPVCVTPDADSLNPSVGPWSPTTNIADDDVASSAGSHAELSWSFAGSSDSVRSDDIEVSVNFGVSDCQPGRCFRLSNLSAQIPTTSYHGYTVSNASLHVWGVAADPSLDSRSYFSYLAGTLYAVVSGRVNGQPFAATSRSIHAATGRSSEISDSFSLHDLVFGFDQSGIHAELRLEIEGTFTNRPPQVSIAVIDAPRDCDDPVAFQARGGDLDADSISYIWLVPSAPSTDGQLLELTLANDETTYLVMTATDDHQRSGSAAIEYTRRCT